MTNQYFDQGCEPTFLLHGSCAHAGAEIIARLANGATDLPGDFVLFAQGKLHGKPVTYLVTSPCCHVPYFILTAQLEAHTVRAGDSSMVPIHGTSIFEVLQQAKLPWEWNRTAVRHMAVLEHMLGAETLHPAVTHLSPGTCYRWHLGRCERREYFSRADFMSRTQPYGEAVARDLTGRQRLDHAVQVFVECMQEGVAHGNHGHYVSLSSGFDSRLLLAWFLREGMEPTCVTMGPAGASDQDIAGVIAQRYGLEHRQIPLRPEDYVTHARDIVRLTGGAKTAKHWHTYLYAKDAGLDPRGQHYIGTNGLFAKSFGFDFGALTLAAQRTGMPVASAGLFLKYWHHVQGNPLLQALCGTGRLQALRDSVGDAARCCATPERSLDQLVEFASFERARHFQAFGHVLLRASSQVFSPYLDTRWMQAISALDRGDRLGGNFHRAAIARVFPGLMDFPIKREKSMAARAPWWYPLRDGDKRGYADPQGVAGLPQVVESVMESPYLVDLVARPVIEKAVRGHHAEAVLLLYTLHQAATLGHEAADGSLMNATANSGSL